MARVVNCWVCYDRLEIFIVRNLTVCRWSHVTRVVNCWVRCDRLEIIVVRNITLCRWSRVTRVVKCWVSVVTGWRSSL